MWLLIAFVAVPLIEIALFIKVGGALGLWPTLGIVLLTALVGTTLMRQQGAMAINQLRGSFSELRDPTEPLVHGAMSLFAGALLLTPGFFTDFVGFALLIPAFRRAAYQFLRSRIKIQSFGAPPPHSTHPHRHDPMPGDVIEGEYQDISDPGSANSPPSGWTKH